MRILIFHGYLLHGTGSNVYNAELARSLVGLGHEVHLLCQDAQAARYDFVDAVGRWCHGRLTVERLREPVRCTAYLPDIGPVLPVYVADHYDGFDARPFPSLTDEQVERYIGLNAAAVRDVAAAAEPDVALANHVVMGPVILARALAGRIPYAVKIHGSALEYTVRPNAARFVPYAREGLASAAGVLVGSRHTAESMWEVVGQPGLPERTRLLPPGVDVRVFRPRSAPEAKVRLDALADRLEAGTPAWGGAADGGQALRAADPTRDRIVSYVGKLIVSKGVDLLIAAWPLVVDSAPDARLMIAGFGEYREGLMDLARAIGAGDLDAARDIARRGRELEGGPPGELRYLAAFLDSLGGAERERYRRAAVARDAAAALHRADRALRRVRAHVRVPGARGAEHVPRGLRHGPGRSGLLRVGAGVGRPLRARGGDRGAAARGRRGHALAAIFRAWPGRRTGDRRRPGLLADVRLAHAGRLAPGHRLAAQRGAVRLQLAGHRQRGRGRGGGPARRPSAGAGALTPARAEGPSRCGRWLASPDAWMESRWMRTGHDRCWRPSAPRCRA